MLGMEEEASNKVPEANGVQDSEDQADEAPVIDIVINNVVCSFAVRCHLDLKRIALEGANVEFRRECGVSFEAEFSFYVLPNVKYHTVSLCARC